MGDSAKYRKLQADIAKLTRQIHDSKILQEDLQLEGAKKEVFGWTIAVKSKKRSVAAQQGSARQGAHAFGAAMGGRQATTLVALIGEAYQELDLFGGRALDEMRPLYPMAGRVLSFFADSPAIAFRTLHPGSFDSLAGTAAMIWDPTGLNTYLHEEVPIWHTTAQIWRSFFTQVTGAQFKTDEDTERD